MQNWTTPDSAKEDRYLLFDSRILKDTHNAELVLGVPKKHPQNPLFGEDHPWEMRFDNLYPNVIFDEEERLYKVWYSPFIVDQSSKGMSIEKWAEKTYRAPYDREMGICYALSEDGLHWTKPALSRVDYRGGKSNNILWRGSDGSRAKRAGPHGAGIFKDLRDPDPRRRYKAILKSEILSVAFSGDGIHWSSSLSCPEANSAGDTHNNAFWAPTLGKYVGITRQWSQSFQRQVARTSSDDFVKWEETKVILEGLDDNLQTYAMPVFYYHGIYVGLLAIHDQASDRVWTELTCSPDTEEWHRVCPGTPFIPNSDMEGDYDWGCVYPSASPIFKNDEIQLFYGGNDGLHTSWRNGFFCLATLRPDGFAGYCQTNRSEEATITTNPVFDVGRPLQVSADIHEKGELLVRALDNSMQVVAESSPISETVTDAEVLWGSDPNLDSSSVKRMSLQFVLRGATVYSFKQG